MAAGLAVAAGLEQRPYAPLWLCGRIAVTWFGDIVVSDNQLLSWFKPTCVSLRAPPTYTWNIQASLLENHIRISPHEEVTSGFSRHARPIDLRVKQREFISLVGGVAVNWPLAAEHSKPSRYGRLCIARGITTGRVIIGVAII
jgi:hypothetical protein